MEKGLGLGLNDLKAEKKENKKRNKLMEIYRKFQKLLIIILLLATSIYYYHFGVNTNYIERCCYLLKYPEVLYLTNY